MKWTPTSLQSRKSNLNCLQFASQHLSPSRLETTEFTAAPVTREIKWAEARGSGIWWSHQRPRLECLKEQNPGSASPSEVRVTGTVSIFQKIHIWMAMHGDTLSPSVYSTQVTTQFRGVFQGWQGTPIVPEPPKHQPALPSYIKWTVV